MLCASVLLIAGCASNFAGVGVPYCDYAKGIYWQSQADLDKTPDDIVIAIDENNTTHERLCTKK